MLADEICMQISRFFHKKTKILKCMQISRLNCFCKQKNVNNECIAGELHLHENCTCPAILFITIECDFHITEQMDELRSMTRKVRLIKPTQKYQEMEWMIVCGRGKGGYKGRGSQIKCTSFLLSLVKLKSIISKFLV